MAEGMVVASTYKFVGCDDIFGMDVEPSEELRRRLKGRE